MPAGEKYMGRGTRDRCSAAPRRTFGCLDRMARPNTFWQQPGCSSHAGGKGRSAIRSGRQVPRWEDRDMRRVALAAALSLMLVTLVGGTVSAHRGGHSPEPSYSAWAGTASQGGRLLVVAMVRHARPGTDYSASAVVHFADGDVTVTLEPRANRRGGHGHHRGAPSHRRGQTVVARGWVPVAATEPPGPVLVDVTIVFGTESLTINTAGLIEGTVPDPDPQPDPPPVYG